MNPRLVQRLLWGTLAVCLAVVATVSITTWVRQSRHRTLPDFGAIPFWSLLDQTGQPSTLENVRGHIWIGNVIFTHCSTLCPMLTEKMYALQQALREQPNVKLLSFSVDPKHDTPDTLAAYAAAHHADPRRWSFLTGTSPELYKVIKDGFHLPLDSVGGDQEIPILHSNKFVLVDAFGHMRGYYDGAQDSSRALILADIESLNSEAKP